jgi:hypothetical protein
LFDHQLHATLIDEPIEHDSPATSRTQDADISADPSHGPLIATAWMRFPHPHDVSDPDLRYLSCH